MTPDGARPQPFPALGLPASGPPLPGSLQPGTAAPAPTRRTQGTGPRTSTPPAGGGQYQLGAEGPMARVLPGTAGPLGGKGQLRLGKGPGDHGHPGREGRATVQPVAHAGLVAGPPYGGLCPRRVPPPPPPRRAPWGPHPDAKGAAAAPGDLAQGHAPSRWRRPPRVTARGPAPLRCLVKMTHPHP